MGVSWRELVVKHTNNGACNFQAAADELVADRDDEIERLRDHVKFLNSFRPDAELAKRDTEIERLRTALCIIVEKDARAMYERCPDCDYDSCYENKRCRNVPLSQIGIVASEALGE